jgi:hypothetical protein
MNITVVIKRGHSGHYLYSGLGSLFNKLSLNFKFSVLFHKLQVYILKLRIVALYCDLMFLNCVQNFGRLSLFLS